MKQQLLIRPYQPSDKATLLAIFKQNVPKYFAESEILDLEEYLDHKIEQYYVAEINLQVVGGGGINFEDNKKVGKISWDFILPEFQGKGIGQALLKHRIEVLKSNKTVEKILVRTSQVAYKFYEKNNFVLTEIIKDYWAKGFDLYSMKYILGAIFLAIFVHLSCPTAALAQRQGSNKQFATRYIEVSGLDAGKKNEKYFHIDNYAALTPNEVTQEVDKLAIYLTSPFCYQEHKVRAIYYWLTHNIKYDIAKYRANTNTQKVQEIDNKKTLKLRAGICGDYSDLFVQLCKTAGIAAYTVSGWSKQGTNIAPHGWNVVQINQKWYFVETTWGSGSVNESEQKFYPNFNEDYFLQAPQEFIKNHFPSDPMWQLLDFPVSYQDFLHEKNSNQTQQLDYETAIKQWVQASWRQQLEANMQRIDKFSQTGQEDDFVKVTKYNLGVAYYNEAVIKYNKGIFLFNKYADYNNQNLAVPPLFRKRKSLALLEPAEDEIMAACEMLKNPIFQENCCKSMNTLQGEANMMLERIMKEKKVYGVGR